MLKGKNYILTILLLLSISLTYSQTGTIKGRIIDSQTEEELVGVALRLDSTAIGAISDVDGSFIIQNVKIGHYSLSTRYIGYESKTIKDIVIVTGNTTYLEIALESESTYLEGVSIIVRRDKESENVLLNDQKNSLTVTKSMGAAELSRKGMNDAAAAISTIAGITKQEGVKNVTVRGLGDRYNATLLNGLPIPSEDPEYKNISLSFFETDIIKSIGIEKVFWSPFVSDVGGAVININSKELNTDKSLGVSISSAFNSRIINNSFIRPDGISYLGFANNKKPMSGQFDFVNHLDPNRVVAPINHSYRISGGRRINFGNQALSFYAVASHSSDYSYTEETVRDATMDGTVYQEQKGKRHSGKEGQLVMANINYDINSAHSIAYNFLMLHSNQYYLGEYFGRNSEKFQDSDNEMGFLRRQQTNDNLLLTNQLLSKWKITDKWILFADASYNRITGNEPDRRENYLSQRANGTYGLTGSNRQKRFFSQLNENDYNAKISVDYQLKNSQNESNSKLSFGYRTQISNLTFEAEEYNLSAVQGELSPTDLSLDKFYNSTNFEGNKFTIKQGHLSSYNVSKNNHSAFVTGSYQFTKSLSGMAGFQFDWVRIDAAYDVPGQKGVNQINSPFYLPNIHLKYNIDSQHILRFGTSKTYTLPQSKEISPYQYVNIGYASEGNPNLKYSDNYNFDLKWDYHLSHSEIVSVTLFYKKIVNPIGRVYKGNSAGLLTYENISKDADVLGVEAELRKNLFTLKNEKRESEQRLTLGLNFSYIYSVANLSLTNTPARKTALEGASPIIVNGDLSYHFSKKKLNLTTTIIVGYFSDRVFTIGTMGYNDIIEKAVPTIDFVLSGKFNKSFGWKVKAGNILDSSYRLTREIQSSQGVITLNQYKKGVNISFGISYDL